MRDGRALSSLAMISLRSSQERKYLAVIESTKDSYHTRYLIQPGAAGVSRGDRNKGLLSVFNIDYCSSHQLRKRLNAVHAPDARNNQTRLVRFVWLADDLRICSYLLQARTASGLHCLRYHSDQHPLPKCQDIVLCSRFADLNSEDLDSSAPCLFHTRNDLSVLVSGVEILCTQLLHAAGCMTLVAQALFEIRDAG